MCNREKPSAKVYSAAEKDSKLIKQLGVMAVRFNLLDYHLTLLICVKEKIPFKGGMYDYISKQMMFAQKLKLAETCMPKNISKRIWKLNEKRVHATHSLYCVEMGTDEVISSHKGKTSHDLVENLSQINQEISKLCVAVHEIMSSANIFHENMWATPPISTTNSSFFGANKKSLG